MRPRLRGGKTIVEAYAPLMLGVKASPAYRTQGGGVVIGGVILSIGAMGRFEGSGPIPEPSERASRFSRTTSPPMTSHRWKSRRVAFGCWLWQSTQDCTSAKSAEMALN